MNRYIVCTSMNHPLKQIEGNMRAESSQRVQVDVADLSISAVFSATATTTAAGWPLTCEGKTEASQMRRPCTPWTRRDASTTPVSGVGLIRALDVYGSWLTRGTY